MNNPYVKTLEPVWRDTKNVRVNEEKLRELIKDMRQKKEEGKLKIPGWTVPNAHPPLDCSLSLWLDFICWVNTVNFAFTNFQRPWNKFTIEYPKGTLWNGAFALQSSFMRAREKGLPVFEAWYLAEISLYEVTHIFRSIDLNHQIPLAAQRTRILREVGKTLIEKYDGSWLNIFEAGDWRAFNRGKGIVEQLVANFPSFRDTRVYNGYRLEFHKRAQLLVMMYHGRAFNSEGRFPLIEDIENIGPICDYDVPKALAFPDVGVLEYSQKMKVLIENHYTFSPLNPMEIENRLAVAYVMKTICDEVGINMAQADFYIWNLGRSSETPHILVTTTDY